MSNIKISEMAEAEQVNDEDLIMIVQDGVNKKTKAKNIGTGNSGGGGDSIEIGTVSLWYSNTIPTNWLLLNGQAISRTEYSELFKILGTAYGEGDGSTTFNLPDMREQVPVGLDANSDTFNVLGKKVGEKKHALTKEELPAKAILVELASQQFQSGAGAWGTTYNSEESNINTKPLGSGQAFDIIQPSFVCNFIIKAKQEKTVQKDLTLSEVLEEVANLVERGHNEKGYYEKYSDGTLKCWGSKEFGTVDINTAFGALFVSSALTLNDFPIPFVDKPILTKWVENGESSAWLINGLPYSTETNPRRNIFSSSSKWCSNKCKSNVYGNR
ncbi:MAG: tail fiber protein [Clostridia bacterium]|nr:tail fiber protein [Clostridia bacterium]